MKLLRAILVYAFSSSVVFSASAQYTANDDNSSCPVCAQINDYMYRITLDPNSAADLDLCKFVSDLDHTHLLEFIGRLTTQLPAKIDKILPSVIRQHYLPCIVVAVKVMAVDNDMFRKLAMGRKMVLDQYLANDIANEYTGGMLYNFCTLAYYMASYMSYGDQSEKLGFRNYAYNNLHYIEYALYGDDTYMENIDPVPDGLYTHLWAQFGDYYSGDYNARIELLICAGVESAYNAGQNQLIVDNARDLIKLGLHILPLYAQEYIGQILGMAGRAVGRESEMSDILKEEIVKRYGKSDLFDLTMTSIAVKNADSQTLTDFETYRNNLRESGYLFADYWPWLCPDEYIDADNYDVYAEYFKESAKLLREVWKGMTNIILSPDKNSKIKPMLDYFECETEERFVLMSFFVANAVFHNGETALALDIIEPALTYYNNVNKTIFPYDVISIAGIYYQLGNVAKVDEILYNYMLPHIDVFDYRDEFLYQELNCTVSCAALLAEFHKDQCDLAIALADKVMSMVDRLQNDEEKADILGLLCGSYYSLDNYERALEVMNRTLQYDMTEAQRAWIELGGAEIYYKMRQWSRAVDVYKRYSGEYSSFVSVPFYCEIMSCAAHSGDKECMRDTADKYIKSIRSEIDDKLYSLSSEEREHFCSSISDHNLFAEICEAVRSDEEQKAVLASCVYDYSLIMKGLLLSADNRIDRLLTEHPDSVVRERYVQMKDLSARIDNMTLRGGDPTQAEFLREALTSAQRDISIIVRSMGAEGEMTGGNSVGWRDVQSQLGEHDVAVEFIRLAVGYDETVDPIYVAVVLRRGWKSPKIVELCAESVLKQYVHIDYLRNRQLYNRFEVTRLWPLIWQPLQEYVAEGETVYFSVDGLLNVLNIEAVRPSGDDRRMADERYVLNRLSSTRELCRSRGDRTVKHAVIYGGLNYDMGVEAMAEQTNAYADLDLAASRSVSRGSIADGALPAGDIYAQTYDEALSIASMLRSTGVVPEVFTGDRGIEESFKALSGEKFELLHLGTHGFYMTGATEYQAGDERLSPMMRAGLMLSRKKSISADDREDGLLLAREIADMDLSSVDLVVLSACQTAQGDITGDGVFGLQRGFKQAGVGSIIMSLWPVDSEMTQYMMTTFYRNLTGGMDRRDAFRTARAEAKAKYPERDWAAFIMLD